MLEGLYDDSWERVSSSAYQVVVGNVGVERPLQIP